MQYSQAYLVLRPVPAHILRLALHIDVLLLTYGFAGLVYRNMHLDKLGCWAQVVIIALMFYRVYRGQYMDQVIKLLHK
ncbi:hypothetical protein D9M71_390240 [compost metagenome]